MRQHLVGIHRVVGWENQDEGRDVGGGHKVEARVAFPAFQGGRVDGLVAPGPDVHEHPSDGLFHPLVQAQLPERVFLGGVDPGAVGGGPHFLDQHRHPQTEVGLPPHVLVQPVVLGGGSG